MLPVAQTACIVVKGPRLPARRNLESRGAGLGGAGRGGNLEPLLY
jgi:hypothetical protein